MFRQFIISFAIFSVAFTQCTEQEENGPCGNPLPEFCFDNFVCDVVQGRCCPPPTTLPASTAAATVVTDASGSTVTVAATSASFVTSTCVDRTNLLTGVSDCPALAYLCNDATYLTLMTQQCPRTCGRCSTTSTSTSCVDRTNNATGVSDCPARAALCNDSRYYTLMTQQCPRTCGRCSSTSSSTTSNTTCADRINLSTGVSDCPARASLCNNSVYYDLMTIQCPRTCGRCNSSSTVTATSSSSTTLSSTCIDQPNPATGISDCPNRRSFCTHPTYISLMRTQCPLTCGFCTSG